MPNPLADPLVDALQRLRLARLLLRRGREQRLALSEALRTAVAMLRERDQELDRVRERYHALLDERREKIRSENSSQSKPVNPSVAA